MLMDLKIAFNCMSGLRDKLRCCDDKKTYKCFALQWQIRVSGPFVQFVAKQIAKQ